MSSAIAPQPPLRRPDPLPAGSAPAWIGEPVPVVHPAWVVHRPRRGAGERGAFARTRTQVRLASADPAAFEPVALVDSHMQVPAAVYARDGETWALLTRYSGRLIHPAELRDHLAEELRDGEAIHGLGTAALRWTPVSAAFAPGTDPKPGSALEWRGKEEGALGTVTRDDRAGASVLLREWLDANVVVAGSCVLMRWRPLLSWHPEDSGGGGKGYVTIAPLDRGLGAVGITPGTLREVQDLARAFKIAPPHDPGPEWRAAAGYRDAGSGHDDIALAVNIQAHHLRHRLERRWDWIRDKRPHSPDREIVESCVLALRPVERRAALGLAAIGEHRSDADLFRHAAALEARIGGPKAGMKTGNAFLHSWLEVVASQRLDLVHEGDAEAIAGLAF